MQKTASTSAGPISGRCLALLALVAGICMALLVARSNFLIDDAFISFRYARNWAEWGVPAYNPGELPPVEGYSNFLWVLLLRVGYQLGVAPELASRILSIGAGLLTLGLLLRYLARELELPAVPTWVGGLALVTMAPFTTWCTGGLETALFGLCLFGAFAGLMSEREATGERARGALLGLLGGALALTRPEGILWVVGLVLVALLAPLLSGTQAPRHRQRVLSFLLVSGVVFAAHLAWRLSVHGEWLPNTVRAKAGLSGAVFGRGMDNLATYGLLFVTPVVALAAILCAGSRSRRSRAAWASTAMILGGCAYNLAVGGDWMPMFRFLAPISPFVAIGFAIVCARLGRIGGSVLGAAALIVALLPSFGQSIASRSLLESFYFRTFRKGYESEYQRWQSSASNTATFSSIGRALASLADGDRSIALGAIGAIGYYSNIIVHDRNGLVDPEVARLPIEPGQGMAGHDRRVARSWFRSRKPDFYEARLYPGIIRGAKDPNFASAARYLGELVLRDGDAALLEHSLPFFHTIEPQEGMPPQTSLLLLKHSDDPHARDLWVQLGLLR